MSGLVLPSSAAILLWFFSVLVLSGWLVCCFSRARRRVRDLLGRVGNSRANQRRMQRFQEIDSVRDPLGGSSCIIHEWLDLGRASVASCVRRRIWAYFGTEHYSPLDLTRLYFAFCRFQVECSDILICWARGGYIQLRRWRRHWRGGSMGRMAAATAAQIW